MLNEQPKQTVEEQLKLVVSQGYGRLLHPFS